MLRKATGWIQGGWGAGLLALVIGAGQPLAQGFREDEVQCEETTAHLADCCPGMSEGDVECDYVDGCGSDTYPTLSIEDSQCIRKKSCDEIRKDGICDRVLARQSDGTPPSEELCR